MQLPQPNEVSLFCSRRRPSSGTARWAASGGWILRGTGRQAERQPTPGNSARRSVNSLRAPFASLAAWPSARPRCTPRRWRSRSPFGWAQTADEREQRRQYRGALPAIGAGSAGPGDPHSSAASAPVQVRRGGLAQGRRRPAETGSRPVVRRYIGRGVSGTAKPCWPTPSALGDRRSDTLPGAVCEVVGGRLAAGSADPVCDALAGMPGGRLQSGPIGGVATASPWARVDGVGDRPGETAGADAAIRLAARIG